MKLSGWSNTNFVKCKISYPKNIRELKSSIKQNVIARGLGRSYGDSSLQPEGTIITKNLNKILSFNKKNGLINVQAGISIDNILKFSIPKGWFLPVTPGSKFISVGGMIASDSHGKNHHRVGSFKNHILELKILNQNKKIATCSRKKNKKLFNYTCGGMGLTGVILSCKFKLIPIETSYVLQETRKTENLDETFKLFYDNASSEYAVGWIDSSSKKIGRSVFFTGKHLKKKELDTNKKKKNLNVEKNISLKIPFFFPRWMLSRYTIKIFNTLYYHFNSNEKKIIHYNKFFYPLDFIKRWNLVYGKDGFICYQCVFPLKESKIAIKKILFLMHKHRLYSFVSVIKLLGKNDGSISFGIKGFTIAFDFPKSEKYEVFLKDMDKVVERCKGKIYLTKDSRISKKFLRKIDKKFSNFTKSKIRKNSKTIFNSLQSNRLEL